MLAGVDYIDALLYINSLADYEKHADPATHRTTFNLVRIGYLCEQLGRPQDTYASVHIAGTKGKGSVAAMIQRAAMAGGLRAGLYTSPHLHTLGERIRVNRHMVSEEEIAALTEEVAAIVERLHAERPEIGRVTTFELLTAMALRYFAQRKVDVAVLETGLGGRLDATNVVMPLVAVITSISLDHTKILGDTLEAIAREKAGIIKEGLAVVSPPQAPEVVPVLADTCRQRGATLYLGGRDWQWEDEPIGDGRFRLSVTSPFGTHRGMPVALLGRHQLTNAAAAVVALEALREKGVPLPTDAIAEGLRTVRWPGRLEVVAKAPTIVLDGAHNEDSARRLREALSGLFPHKRLILILGVSADKDIAAIIRELTPIADQVIVTRSTHPRSATVELLLERCHEQGVAAEAAEDLAAAIALARAQAGPQDLICVTGSLYAVADAREACGLESVT